MLNSSVIHDGSLKVNTLGRIAPADRQQDDTYTTNVTTWKCRWFVEHGNGEARPCSHYQGTEDAYKLGQEPVRPDDLHYQSNSHQEHHIGRQLMYSVLNWGLV